MTDNAYTITTIDEASSASNKIRRETEQLNELKAWRDREIARIEKAFEAEAKRHEDSIEFFTHALTYWLQKQVADGRRTKSYTLPGGTIRLRKRPPTLTITDEDALRKWAVVNAPELIQVKTSLDRRSLLKLVDFVEGGTVISKDGEPLPVSWVDEGESSSFSVEV